MNRERLTELLQDPARVEPQDLEALRTMAEKYPWFSGAHLLLAVGEHGSHNVLTNDRDSLPAAFLPSRGVLFDLVNKEEAYVPSTLRLVKEDEPVRPVPSEDAPPAAPPQEPPGAFHPLPTGVEEKKESRAEKDQPATLDTAAEEPPTGAGPQEDPGTADTDAGQEVLDRQIIAAIKASGYELGREEGAHPPPAPPRTERPPVAPSPVPEPPVPEPPAPPAPAAAPPTTIAAHTRLRFTDWLDQGKQSGPVAQGSIQPAQPPAAVPLPATTKGPVQSQREIMDHFIQQSKPAQPAEKAAFFNPQQAAKRSLQDDGLVSETLARIHEQQGNFSKAREIYDRLSVKHPEKSVYFAALSKALEGRVNN